MKPFALVCLALVATAPPAFGQQPGWSHTPLSTGAADPDPVPLELPAPVAEVPRPKGFPTYAPERVAPADPLPPPPQVAGQQHWVSL